MIVTFLISFCRVCASGSKGAKTVRTSDYEAADSCSACLGFKIAGACYVSA